MGVTGAQGAVEPQMLEASVRDVLNLSAFWKLVVLEPLKVTIKNFPESKAIKIKVPDFPNDPEKGSHEIHFDRVIFIEKSDFKENYTAGSDLELICSCENVDKVKNQKPKSNPLEIEVRLYEKLFKDTNPEDPNEVPNGFLSENSYIVCRSVHEIGKGLRQISVRTDWFLLCGSGLWEMWKIGFQSHGRIEGRRWKSQTFL